MSARMRWLLRARPADYMLALSVAGASLPVVGKSLEPAGWRDCDGGLGRPAIAGIRFFHCEDIPDTGYRRGASTGSREHARSLRSGLAGASCRPKTWTSNGPRLTECRRCGGRCHRRYLYRPAVHYGHSPAQLLDVWRRRHLPTEPAPVLIFVPGGAWVHGRRDSRTRPVHRLPGAGGGQPDDRPAP